MEISFLLVWQMEDTLDGAVTEESGAALQFCEEDICPLDMDEEPEAAGPVLVRGFTHEDLIRF